MKTEILANLNFQFFFIEKLIISYEYFFTMIILNITRILFQYYFFP